MFQISHCPNRTNEICSPLRYAMKLKNSEMYCVQASAQMQSVILKLFGFITVYLYCYSSVITLITLSVLLRIY